MHQSTKSSRGGNGGNSGPIVVKKRQVIDIHTENRWTV